MVIRINLSAGEECEHDRREAGDERKPTRVRIKFEDVVERDTERELYERDRDNRP
ncbi:MAG TPA: hypothetical protein VNY27_08140 [Solirubrobacteraceae bacterium]|jgi:hypothetical protein|nr:hypothetical protein [Solirubrobacteraceae bacterium]